MLVRMSFVWILSAGRSANHGRKQARHKADMAVRIFNVSSHLRFLLCW